nr:uncharacterized protein LOC106621416 isoform X5 [Bactrocera oleae]
MQINLQLFGSCALEETKKMEYEDKIELMTHIFECIEEAMEVDSDDCEKEDICEDLFNMFDKVAEMPIEKKKRQWVKVWREKRSVNGSHSFLIKELLSLDKNEYKNYVRMSDNQFGFILSAVNEDLLKEDTRMRAAISPAEKLSLTLRFLATVSKQFLRVGFYSQ